MPGRHDLKHHALALANLARAGDFHRIHSLKLLDPVAPAMAQRLSTIDHTLCPSPKMPLSLALPKPGRLS